MLNDLLQVLTGTMPAADFALQFCVILFTWVVCLSVHESAHAWTAEKLGDPTGRLSGRITLNPMAHISLPGALMMLIFGFGYAKPVPVNIRNFKNRKVGFALTSLAGPVSNLLMALLFTLIANGILAFVPEAKYVTSFAGAAVMFFSNVGYVNVALAVFNLIPFPPLDGSRLISVVLPDRLYYKLLSVERYLMYVLFALIFLFNRIGFSPIGAISNAVFRFISHITYLPFTFLN